MDCESTQEDHNSVKGRISTRISEVLLEVGHFRVFASISREILAPWKI